ncbi:MULTISPECIES: hypothetical protein [Sphingobacterium]|uniref:hypothetical protein n=1 Tax=Sphingobacterium TaxID=28453 RepID=UPI00257C3A63|nr:MULTISPECIES: hypothetical protein [Sphingobacterium]
MKIYDAQIAKKNILNFFKKSGITIEDFANILGTSDRWIKYIQSNEKYVFDVEIVKKASSFFVVEYSNMSSTVLNPPNNLRQVLQKKHSKNPEYSKILNDTPTVSFIIENILAIDGDFKNSNGLELKYIKNIIKKYYPNMKLTTLSSELQKSTVIESSKSTTKINTNLYKLK